MKLSNSRRRSSTASSKSSKVAASDHDHDHHVPNEDEAIARGGVATPFPWKLHEMLDDASKEGNEWIVSWQPHGRSFLVHKPKIFVEKIMPTYFNQSKFASFQRQLNLYGFNRLTAGKDKGAYYHSCFVRGQKGLCRGMVRQKIKGTKVRRTLAPEEEPDFYLMTNTPVPPGSPEKEPTPTKTASSGSSRSSSTARMPPLPGKEQAMMKAHQDRLKAVRDVLRQTETYLEDVDQDDDEDVSRKEEEGFAATMTLDPIPSVSPVESEESDLEEESHGQTNNARSFSVPSSRSSSMTSMASSNAGSAPDPPVAPLSSMTFTPSIFDDLTPEQIKGGDLLFFEGKPFHYLEHLDSLPSVPLKNLQQPPNTTVQSQQQQQQQQGVGVSPAYKAYPRDSLQSLMRADPQALMGVAFNMYQVPS